MPEREPLPVSNHSPRSLPCPALPPAPGNHRPTLCPCSFAFSGPVPSVESHGTSLCVWLFPGAGVPAAAVLSRVSVCFHPWCWAGPFSSMAIVPASPQPRLPLHMVDRTRWGLRGCCRVRLGTKGRGMFCFPPSPLLPLPRFCVLRGSKHPAVDNALPWPDGLRGAFLGEDKPPT